MKIYHQAREAVSGLAGEFCLLETIFVAKCEAFCGHLSLTMYVRVLDAFGASSFNCL